MTTANLQVDIAIIGGGIAGLWLLNRLRSQGYEAVLFEQNTLGGGQTIASQGMIHGGIKYALGGALSGASEAIADMPEHWRRCLRGEGDVDISQSRILSDHFYMWSTKSITSKLTSFFASKLSRGRVDSLQADQYPTAFNHPDFRGNLYKLADLVLDTPSLVESLRNNCRESIFSIDWQTAQLKKTVQDDAYIQFSDGLTLNASQFIFSAGEGNEQLLQAVAASAPVMQRRPLQQVLFKHELDLPLYAHCMGSNPAPRLTISSHRCSDGRWAWYLGGDLATENIDTSEGILIDKAKQEINSLFPWLDFNNQKTSWATVKINRAEPKQKHLLKPDKAFVANASDCNNVIVAWPTKLTLAPNLADETIALLQQQQCLPSQQPCDLSPLTALGSPAIGKPLWETLF